MAPPTRRPPAESEAAEPANPFAIDTARLDREWVEQASHTRAAGRREADARHAHAQAKARLDVGAARMKLAIRQHPDRYSLREKPTVDEVESTLVMQRDYQELVDAVNVAKRDLDYAGADTNAFLDRRKALERLVELMALDYFSEKEPRAAGGVGREWAETARRRGVRADSD